MLNVFRPIKLINILFFLKHRELFSRRRTLDFGCGRGSYRKLLKNFRSKYYGLDFKLFNSEIALEGFFDDKKYLEYHYYFDVIMLFDVLQHLKDPDEIILKLGELLNDNGSIIICVPFVFPICDYEDYNRWTSNGIEIFMKEKGFQLKKRAYRGGILSALFYVVLMYFINLIIGDRAHWQLSNSIKKLLIALLEIFTSPLGYACLLLDSILPKGGVYIGTIDIYTRRRYKNDLSLCEFDLLGRTRNQF